MLIVSNKYDYYYQRIFHKEKLVSYEHNGHIITHVT
jgi:hypothetical protein